MIERLLIVAILAIGFVFLALTVLIVANKVLRETREAWRRRRRRELEPQVLGWAHGDEPSLPRRLGGRVRRADRHVLRAILLDHLQRVRGIERDRLSRAYDELGLVDRDLAGLRSSRWWQRARAAERLGIAGASRATHALVRLLDDPSTDVRIRAATALGAVGGTAAMRPLIQALEEPSRWSTIRIADILSGMGRRVVEELVTLYPRLGLHGRLAAIDVLGRVHSLDAATWLRIRLSDDHRDVRARACHALGAIGDTDSGPALVHALHDPEWPVRAMAAKSLGRLRFTAGIPTLALAVRDREWWVRANAAEALRAMGEAGLEALDRMLDDRDPYARHQAVLMLQEAGVLDEQIDALAAEDAQRRQRAEALVRRLVGVGQLARLREIQAGHANPAVRLALGRLVGPNPDGER